MKNKHNQHESRDDRRSSMRIENAIAELVDTFVSKGEFVGGVYQYPSNTLRS